MALAWCALERWQPPALAVLCRSMPVRREFATPELVELVVQHDGPRPLDGDSGLADLRERAALFGGSFTLDSAPGSGAAVTVRVRLGNEDHGEDPRVDCR